MQIVIDMSDDVMDAVKRGCLDTKEHDLGERITEIIENGTPLQNQGYWECVDPKICIYSCSECNSFSGKVWNFCPHCGAKMKGER